MTLAVLTAVVSFVMTVQREHQQLLEELVRHHVESSVLAIASAAEPADFDNPAFYDQLRRAVRATVHGPLNVVGGVSGSLRSGLGAVAVLLALFTIEPRSSTRPTWNGPPTPAAPDVTVFFGRRR